MNILIVRVSSLGDVVHNMPMLADIKRRYPLANIDWVVEEAYTDLVRLNAHVRNVIPFALRRWRKNLFASSTRNEFRTFRDTITKEKYDYVFDTQGLLKTGVVMGLTKTVNGGQKVGLANATEDSGYEGVSRFFHTKSVPVDFYTHAVTRGRLVAAAAMGYEIDTAVDFGMQLPDLRPEWLPSTAYAVFFHGTARKSKQWVFSRWVEIGKFLARRNVQILLPWGSDEEHNIADQLADQMTNATVLPRLSMMGAVFLAGNAAITVGVDTGLTHVSAAFNRPTVELYCDSPRWKTQGYWSSSIINLGEKGLPPTVDEVEEAMSRLLC